MPYAEHVHTRSSSARVEWRAWRAGVLVRCSASKTFVSIHVPCSHAGVSRLWHTPRNVFPTGNLRDMERHQGRSLPIGRAPALPSHLPTQRGSERSFRKPRDLDKSQDQGRRTLCTYTGWEKRPGTAERPVGLPCGPTAQLRS